jgi:hypothetical protein
MDEVTSSTMSIRRLMFVLIFALVVPAWGTETPATSANDPLGRTTPQDAVYQFLEACHARQYTRAAHYLDLRQMQTGDRQKNGPELATWCQFGFVFRLHGRLIHVGAKES